MLKQIPKLVLLVALLVTLIANAVPAKAGSGCVCWDLCKLRGGGKCPPVGKCNFDPKTSQCTIGTCTTSCAF